MSRKKLISFVFGTRPEAIKLAPLILEAKREPNLEVNICVTGQHRQMLDSILTFFNIKPDCDLNLMTHNQDLQELTSLVLTNVADYLKAISPDYVVVQGDTTTVMATSLAAFYQKIKICHVEAGLRTGDKYSPYPEEINRKITSALGDLHFAPTEHAKQNLLKEGIEEGKVFVTGNTVIDALLLAKIKISKKRPKIESIPDEVLGSNSKIVLITGHRRENFGDGFISICEAIETLAGRFPDIYFVYPVHLNPNVKEPVYRLLGGKSNVLLLPPLEYDSFVYLMNRAYLIMSDSGGIQEEAPSLKKPVIIMRENTERPEGVKAGLVKLVGTDKNRIITETELLIRDESAYNAMIHENNPYGDGFASSRILKIILADK